jgi:amino acid transporter
MTMSIGLILVIILIIFLLGGFSGRFGGYGYGYGHGGVGLIGIILIVLVVLLSWDGFSVRRRARLQAELHEATGQPDKPLSRAIQRSRASVTWRRACLSAGIAL